MATSRENKAIKTHLDPAGLEFKYTSQSGEIPDPKTGKRRSSFCKISSAFFDAEKKSEILIFEKDENAVARGNEGTVYRFTNGTKTIAIKEWHPYWLAASKAYVKEALFHKHVYGFGGHAACKKRLFTLMDYKSGIPWQDYEITNWNSLFKFTIRLIKNLQKIHEIGTHNELVGGANILANDNEVTIIDFGRSTLGAKDYENDLGELCVVLRTKFSKVFKIDLSNQPLRDALKNIIEKIPNETLTNTLQKLEELAAKFNLTTQSPPTLPLKML